MSIDVIEQKDWYHHQLIRQVTWDKAGRPVPFLAVMPDGGEAALPCILAIHGFTSKKEEWLEFDGYTKGGNLVKALADHGYAVIAIDLYGHGDHHTDTPVDYDELAEDGWEEFFHGSLESIEAVFDNYLAGKIFDQNRLGFLSYSVGGIFGFWLANRQVNFKTLVMCVPPVDKEEDDEYAPYNNLDQLKAPMLIFAGSEDEHIALEDSKWLCDQLPMADKQLVIYPSGHSLPVDYVSVALEWYRKKL